MYAINANIDFADFKVAKIYEYYLAIITGRVIFFLHATKKEYMTAILLFLQIHTKNAPR